MIYLRRDPELRCKKVELWSISNHCSGTSAPIDYPWCIIPLVVLSAKLRQETPDIHSEFERLK